MMSWIKPLVLWIFDAQPKPRIGRTIMSMDTAKDIAVGKTMRFGTSFFDSEKTILRRLKEMEDFEKQVTKMECANLQSAYRNFISYHRNEARRNLGEARKRAAVRAERRKLGL